jgi:nucleoid-associated protein YgaU
LARSGVFINAAERALLKAAERALINAAEQAGDAAAAALGVTAAPGVTAGSEKLRLLGVGGLDSSGAGERGGSDGAAPAGPDVH